MNTAMKCMVTTAFAWGLTTAAMAQGNAGGTPGGNGAGRGGVGIATTPNGNGETGTPPGPTGKHSKAHLKRHHEPKNHS